MGFPYESEYNLGRVREGYHEFKDRDEWTVRIGIEQTDLRPNVEGVVSNLPPYRGAYPNFCLDHHPAVEGPDPVQEAFPAVEVHSYALIVPESRLITTPDGSQGAPFWMNFNDSSRGAVIISLKGNNPLTYMPARAGLEYEEIEAWGKTVRVQNWISLVGGRRDWIDGFPTDPIRMHEADATVRQAIFTTNPRLGVAQYVIPPEERKNTLSFMFFRPVVWEPPRRREVRRKEFLGVEEEQFLGVKGATMRGICEEFEVAAGGLIAQAIVRDQEGPEYYQSQPRVLFRYYPVTREQADELKATMPGPRDAITSMRIPTFGAKGGNG